MGNRPLTATLLCENDDSACSDEILQPAAKMDDLSQMSHLSQQQHPQFCTSKSSETMGREARTDRENLSRFIVHNDDEREEVSSEMAGATASLPEMPVEEDEEEEQDENQDPSEQADTRGP